MAGAVSTPPAAAVVGATGSADLAADAAGADTAALVAGSRADVRLTGRVWNAA